MYLQNGFKKIFRGRLVWVALFLLLTLGLFSGFHSCYLEAVPPPETPKPAPSPLAEGALPVFAALESERPDGSAALPARSAAPTDTGTPMPSESGVSTDATDGTPAAATMPPVTATLSPGQEVFEGAAFLGDSRTEGFLTSTGLLGKVAGFYHTGLNVKSAMELECIATDAGSVTPVAAIAQASYTSIYVMLGINELGWPLYTTFKSTYGQLLDALIEAQPEATIYVQSIIPVGRNPVVAGDYINNDNVRIANEVIAELAAEKGLVYLDVYSVMVDEAGFLPDEAAPDGVHLGSDYCRIWRDFLIAGSGHSPLTDD